MNNSLQHHQSDEAEEAFFCPVVELWDKVSPLNCPNKFTELLESLANLWLSSKWRSLESIEKARLLWLSNILLNTGHEGATQSYAVSQVISLNPAHELLVTEMRRHLVKLRTSLPSFQPPPPAPPPAKQQVLKKLGWSEAVMSQFNVLEESFLQAFQAADMQWALNHNYGVYLVMVLVSQDVKTGRWHDMTPYYKACQVSALASKLTESDVNLMRGGKLLKAMTCHFNDFLTARQAELDESEQQDAPAYTSPRPILSNAA